MTTRLARSLSTTVVLLALSSLIACASDEGADKDQERLGFVPNQERARFKNLKTKGLEITPLDLNKDGKPDQWKLVAGGRLVRVERDLNFDGVPDVFLYQNDAGEVLEEEMDLDVDGIIDVVNYYRGGIITRKEMSVDFTGNVSIIKYFDPEGKLTRTERDTDNNGRIDVWEYYQDDVRIRTGRDISGDGTPDVFEEAKTED